MDEKPIHLNVRQYAMLAKEITNKHLFMAVLQILKNRGLVDRRTRLKLGKPEGAYDSGCVERHVNHSVITLKMRNFGAFAQLLTSAELDHLGDGDPVAEEYYCTIIILEILEILSRDSVSL